MSPTDVGLAGRAGVTSALYYKTIAWRARCIEEMGTALPGQALEKLREMALRVDPAAGVWGAGGRRVGRHALPPK